MMNYTRIRNREGRKKTEEALESPPGKKEHFVAYPNLQ